MRGLGTRIAAFVKWVFTVLFITVVVRLEEEDVMTESDGGAVVEGVAVGGKGLNAEKCCWEEALSYFLLVDNKANEEAISAGMKKFAIQRAKLHGWPNTYVLTKAMGEMLTKVQPNFF
ncbi:fatty acyl-CoA reductase 3 [Tanacetum coccineum]